MWFKVVLNKDLSIASCEQVASAFDDAGRHVIYCEADDKAGALKYAKLLAGARLRSRERRAFAKAAGRCQKCGYGFADPKHQRCKDKDRIWNQETREAEALGVARLPLPSGPRSSFGSLRGRVLEEVRQQYVRLSRSDFYAWLESEIKAANWRRTG